MDNSPQAPNHPSIVKGRRKVKIEKMKNKNHLQVTFSKRRYGLFKKASELCTLTGCEIGIIINSPGHKMLSFGHPSIDNIVDACFPTEGTRAMKNIPMSPMTLQMEYDEKLKAAHKTIEAMEENKHLSELEAQMEVEKQATIWLKEREKGEMVGYSPLKEMTESELLELGACLNTLNQDIKISMANIFWDQANPNSDLEDIPNFNMSGEVNPMNNMNVFGYQEF